MIKNLKEQKLLLGTENDKFVDQHLEQILESKYKRRFEMLEMYQDGRYEEGYELINYNLSSRSIKLICFFILTNVCILYIMYINKRGELWKL